MRWARFSDGLVALFGLSSAIVALPRREGDPEPGELGIVQVTVQVEYDIRKELDDEQQAALPDFIGVVGWMHAWPYIRAEVQELSAKLRFNPPVTLPVLLAGQTCDVPVEEVDFQSGEPE